MSMLLLRNLDGRDIRAIAFSSRWRRLMMLGTQRDIFGVIYPLYVLVRAMPRFAHPYEGTLRALLIRMPS